MPEENGKPQKYFAEIKEIINDDTGLSYWKVCTEACESAAKAKQELKAVAPTCEFSWRIIKVAESGRSMVDTRVILTSV